MKKSFKFILLALGSVFIVPSLLAAPRIGCNSPKYDFGTLIESEKITHEFILRNRGDHPLVIATIKNCCGVESSITPKIILPGSNAVCTVIFTTRNRYGKQNKQILIASNDRKHPYFELKLVGMLQRPVEFSPRFIRLGAQFPDSEINQIITATNLLKKTVVLESVISKLNGIEVTANAQSPRSWTIQMRSSEPLTVGKLNGQILLNFSTGTMTVPVIGLVKPILQVVPEKIQFTTRATQFVERLVMVRSGDGRAFEIRSAKVEEGKGSAKIKKLANGRWQLNVSVLPNSLSEKSTLRVETSCSSQQSITIPLLVRSPE